MAELMIIKVELQDKGTNMIEHIVLFKLKAATTKEQIQTLTQGLLKMADEIAGIEEISAGANTSPEGLNRGYNYGMIVRFVDAEARDAYIPHPFHQGVVKEYIHPNVDEVLVLDYET